MQSDLSGISADCLAHFTRKLPPRYCPSEMLRTQYYANYNESILSDCLLSKHIASLLKYIVNKKRLRIY